MTGLSRGELGANMMRDHNIVFDYDNHRVGFADGICDYHADSKGPEMDNSAVAKVCSSIGCVCMCGGFFLFCFFVSCCFVGCCISFVMAQTNRGASCIFIMFFFCCICVALPHRQEYRMTPYGVHITTQPVVTGHTNSVVSRRYVTLVYNVQ